MTDERREAQGHETPSLQRETPQRPRNRSQRRLAAAAALAGAVLVAGGASAVVLGAGSAGPHVHTHSTGSLGQGITTKATGTTTPPTRPAQTALTAVSTYWEAIGRHDFAAAYAVLAPGAVPQTEAQWASAEDATGVESVRFTGHAGDVSGTEATVTVASLVTEDSRFGCRSWTGTYRVIRPAGHWLIAHAAITPTRCATA